MTVDEPPRNLLCAFVDKSKLDEQSRYPSILQFTTQIRFEYINVASVNLAGCMLLVI